MLRMHGNVKIESNTCSCCLSCDRELQPLGECYDIFQTIMQDKPNILQKMDLAAVCICWECSSLLRKVLQFQAKVENAQVVLQLAETQNLMYPSLTTLTNVTITGQSYFFYHHDVEKEFQIKFDVDLDTDIKTDAEYLDLNTEINEVCIESVPERKMEENYTKIEIDDDFELVAENRIDDDDSELVAENRIDDDNSELVAENRIDDDDSELVAENRIDDDNSELVAENRIDDDDSELVAENRIDDDDSELVAENRIDDDDSELAAENRIDDDDSELVAENTIDDDDSELVAENRMEEDDLYEEDDDEYLDLDSNFDIELDESNVKFYIPNIRKLEGDEPYVCKEKYVKVLLDKNIVTYKPISIEREEVSEWIEKERLSKRYLKNNFRCHSCAVSFKFESGLIIHENKYHKPSCGKHVCDICEKRFPSAKYLNIHNASHYLKYQCLICNKVMYGSLRKNHIGLYHRVMYQCSECEMQFWNRTLFFEHYKAWHRLYICDYCGVKFRRKSKIMKHLSLKHSEHKCEECNKTFKRREGLLNHNILIHVLAVGDEAYCVECDIKFPTVRKYKSHLTESVKHAKKERGPPVKCLACDKLYTRKSFMMNHYRKEHLKKTKYYCQECDKYFLVKIGLKQHMWYYHEGKEPKKDKICTICGRGFSTRRMLTNHVNSHNGVRPHECPHCPAKFVQKHSMKSHVKYIHLKVKRKK